MTATTPDLLATIVAATRTAVAAREAVRPLTALEREQSRQPDDEAFTAALRCAPAPRIIAECKRRSPSRGILRHDYDAASHARVYATAGAAGISVLTEPTFFDGSLSDLQAVRAVVDLPLLRKDFIVTDYQLYETVVSGADAVLLIVGALDDVQLRRLLDVSAALRLAALVEVHGRDELRRALDLGARIIGVNSRNLRTLTVDRQVFEELAVDLHTTSVTAVAESGIRSGDDMRRLSMLGYHAFLVGERLITQPDPGAALRQLRTS